MDFQNFTPLEVAINNGHTEIAEFLLEKSNDFSEHSKGYIALHAAAAKGDVRILNLLIEKKSPSISRKKKVKDNPLCIGQCKKSV
ncbi:ankyrin repeat domain-containing protein [Planococcus kocurii]|uniref:ankyrin repeat domain-containing protein n=1 Tax=Planococcus TaxID=1372 RepID=UPI0011ED356C|nr:ankyrin repeat domain-containing protein [Planococcus sp. ANT_H30]KAA0957591.1 ankyrin repeat domain-containing protein [Planococcus sp. ANT_H30]